MPFRETGFDKHHRFPLCCLLRTASKSILSILLFAVPAGIGYGQQSAPAKVSHGLPENPYSIAGLPQQEFSMDSEYENGSVLPLPFSGTLGYIIKPNGPVDPQRRWVWIAPLWVAMRATPSGKTFAHYYADSLLKAGFHVVGLDVGASCGSPAGVELYQKFYEMLVDTYQLHPEARLLGVSNGGLISYAWAFRYPNEVNRIFGVYPVMDMRSWPGLSKVAGPVLVPQPPDPAPGRITPEGLAYLLTLEELEQRLAEFNPIDNLAPLAQAKVKILHIHGDQDKLVPLEPNSGEAMRRYKALGGQAELEVVPGLGHGGSVFFEFGRGVQFLTE